MSYNKECNASWRTASHVSSLIPSLQPSPRGLKCKRPAHPNSRAYTPPRHYGLFFPSNATEFSAKLLAPSQPSPMSTLSCSFELEKRYLPPIPSSLYEFCALKNYQHFKPPGIQGRGNRDVAGLEGPIGPGAKKQVAYSSLTHSHACMHACTSHVHHLLRQLKGVSACPAAVCCMASPTSAKCTGRKDYLGLPAFVWDLQM